MAGYFVVECLIFNGSEWLQESKPSLAKMLEGEAYAPKCLPGAECRLDGLVILALDQGLHTPVVVRYHMLYMLSHVGVWNCDGGVIRRHGKFTGGISMIHNDIYIYTPSLDKPESTKSRFSMARLLGVLPRLLRTNG
jgi:hypothetical protein